MLFQKVSALFKMKDINFQQQKERDQKKEQHIPVKCISHSSNSLMINSSLK